MSELLPCPFCGGKPVFDHDDNGWNWIVCSQCQCSTNASVSCMDDCRPLLAEAWNRRASPSAPASEPVANSITEALEAAERTIQQLDEARRVPPELLNQPFDAPILAMRRREWRALSPEAQDKLMQITGALHPDEMRRRAQAAEDCRKTPLVAAPSPAEDRDAEDARRYRWLREILHSAKGSASVEVNQHLAYYEEPEPGKEVKIQWYPNTPIGFYVAEASTLDEAIDAAMQVEGSAT